MTSQSHSIKAHDFTRDGVEVAALMAKLVTTNKPRPRFNPDDANSVDPRFLNEFLAVSNKLVIDARDAENTMRLFPEMELITQIIVSMTVSPKDMTGSDLLYRTPDCLLPASTAAKAVAKVKSILEKEYKIRQSLPEIIRDCVFDRGSHVRVIIPESSLDELINGGGVISRENMSTVFKRNPDGAYSYVHKGYLGSPDPSITNPNSNPRQNKATEAFRVYKPQSTYDPVIRVDGQELPIEMWDNPEILKLPSAAAANAQNRVRHTLAKESNMFNVDPKLLTHAKIRSLLYSTKNTHGIYKPLNALKSGEETLRISVGKPLDLKAPPEAVIPIYVPGNVKEHVGYIFLIDNDGNFLSVNSPGTIVGNVAAVSSSNGSDQAVMSLLQQRVTNDLQGFRKNSSLVYGPHLFADITEHDIGTRIKNGIMGKEYSIGKNPLAFQIMMARSLSNQRTNMLFVPAEMVTYFAYKYDKDGTGISMHAEAATLNGLRAVVMFSRVQNMVRNSVGETLVNVEFSEDDANPRQTAEDVVAEITNMQQVSFPRIGSNPNDYYSWVRKAGWKFAFSGNPLFPQMKIDVSNESGQRTVPSDELEADLKKRQIQYFGIPSEIIENQNIDFATVFETSSVLLAKRIAILQEIFSPKTTHYARSIIRADGEIVNLIKECITEDMDIVQNYVDRSDLGIDSKKLSEDDLQSLVELLTMDFINCFTIELPKPNTVSIANQKAALEQYDEFLELGITKGWINDDMITAESNGTAADAKAGIPGIKAYFMRKYMADNNILPELAELTSIDNEGKPQLDFATIVAEHNNLLTRMLTKFQIVTKPAADAATADIERLAAGADGGASEMESQPEDDGSGGGEGGDDDLSIDDGLGALDDNSAPSDTDTAPPEDNGGGEEAPNKDEAVKKGDDSEPKT